MGKSCNVGEKHGKAKFEDTLVVSLRKEFKENRFVVKQRAEELGVCTNTLECVLKGITYKHLPNALRSLSMKLSREKVDELRKNYVESPFDIGKKAEELDVSEHTLRKN